MRNYSEELYEFFNILIKDEERWLKEEELNLTITELHFISYFTPLEKFMISQLAEKIKLSQSATSLMIDNLIKKGYIQRERCEDDRRKVYVSLTKKGIEVYNIHLKFHQKRFESICKGIKESELHAFFETLRKFKINLLAVSELEEIEKNILDFEEGDQLLVKNITGGVNRKGFLAQIGCLPGETLKLIKKPFTGPIIIELKGAKLSLGRNIAQAVKVEKVG